MTVHTVDQKVKPWDRFIRSDVNQSTSNQRIFMDYVNWDNLKAAQTAAKAMEQDESMPPFIMAIEKVEIFQHFNSLKPVK